MKEAGKGVCRLLLVSSNMKICPGTECNPIPINYVNTNKLGGSRRVIYESLSICIVSFVCVYFVIKK